MSKRELPTTKVPWARLSMLVNLHTPELKGHLEAVYLAGSRMGSALGSGIMQSSADPGRNQALLNSLDEALSGLDAAVDSMRKAIVTSSESLSDRAASSAGKPGAGK